jgi:hypothetical protein
MITRLKTEFKDRVRLTIGDKEKLLFDDDELDSFVEQYSAPFRTEADIQAYDSKYKLNMDRPVYELRLEKGFDPDGVYLLDEGSVTIKFDVNDPANSGTPPVDGDVLEVSYYEVDFANLISELFFILSSNHAKLVIAQSIMGISMNLTQLSDSFFKKSTQWAN